MTVRTPPSLLAAALDTDPSGPLLTFYDDATGERVELSATSLDNWVAKTANMLVDGLAAEPGERVAIRLPPHWLGAVWMLAAWSAGLVVHVDSGEGGDPPECEVAVVGPDDLDQLQRSRARDLVALSLLPLGGPFADPLPADLLDYGAEVLAYGDRFVPLVPVAEDAPALVRGAENSTAGDLAAGARVRAGVLGLGPGSRLLTTANPTTAPGHLDALLAPLAASTSIVLVRNPDPARQDQRVAAEKVTHSAD